MRLLLWLASFAMLYSGEENPSIPQLFAWFDRLGFEDLRQAKFARIWTGKWMEVGQASRLEQDISNGFVMEDRGDTFRVVLADLSVTVLQKHGTNPADREFCGYREQSLAQEVERLLKALENPQHFEIEQQKQEETHFAYFNRLPEPARVFVIARACAQHGMNDL